MEHEFIRRQRAKWEKGKKPNKISGKTFTKFCRKLWQRAVVGLKQTEKIELKMAKGRGARRLGNVDR